MAVRITSITSTAGVSPIVTKGFGATKFRVVTQGYGPIGTLIQQIITVSRGGRTVLRDMYGEKIEEFKIAVQLVSISGKEVLSPILNRSKHIVNESTNASVKVTNGRINKKEKSVINVFANMIKVKRGSDGNY